MILIVNEKRKQQELQKLAELRYNTWYSCRHETNDMNGSFLDLAAYVYVQESHSDTNPYVFIVKYTNPKMDTIDKQFVIKGINNINDCYHNCYFAQCGGDFSVSICNG